MAVCTGPDQRKRKEKQRLPLKIFLFFFFSSALRDVGRNVGTARDSAESLAISTLDGGHTIRLCLGKRRKFRKRRRKNDLKRQQPERKGKYRKRQCRANRKQHPDLSELSVRHDNATPTLPNAN